MLFIAPEHKSTLESLGLESFEALWNFPIDWFEPPNFRRGGWSGVGRVEFMIDPQKRLNVFIKKQENHGRLTLLHPFEGEPTFRREFKNLQFLQENQFSAPKVVCYAEENVNGNKRAILITEALDDFISLENLTAQEVKKMDRNKKNALIQSVAKSLRKFHLMGIMHRALYPKHIFIKNPQQTPQVALIDLEKARYSLNSHYRAFFDLAALNRHAEFWSRSQRLKFFILYYGLGSLSKHPSRFFFKRLCRAIIKRSQR
jgi:tRNA A-37 threonylcarbamoyl transferase component Bud32